MCTQFPKSSPVAYHAITSVLRVLPSHIYPTRYQTCMEIPRLAPPAWCAPHQCHPVLGQLPAPRGPHEPACAGGSQLLMPASLFLKYLFLFFEKKKHSKTYIQRDLPSTDLFPRCVPQLGQLGARFPEFSLSLDQ